MATRFYLGKQALSAGPPVSPSSWSAGWNKTSGGITCAGLTAPSHTTGASHNNPASGTSGHFTAIARYVMPAFAQAHDISGTIKGQIRCSQGAAGDNYTLAVAAKVIQSDGSDRGVLLAVTGSDDTSATPPEFSTTLTNRRFRDASENASITLSNVAVQKGDRIVVEVGFRQASTSTTNGTISPLDLTTIADLPEDDTTTGSNNAWIEFSQDFVLIPRYVASVTVPVDGASATNTADPTAVTPPSGMLAGDLVLMIGQQRATGATLAISSDGGQSWTSETAISTTNETARLFWCTFDGTWDSNPSVDFSAALCNSVQMHVFRPPEANWTWSVNQALTELDIAAAPHTIVGQTGTGNHPTLTFAGWFTADDNTWNGNNTQHWFIPGSQNESAVVWQHRNTSGSDQSAAYMYRADPAGTASGNVTRAQATLGDDPSTTFIITFVATPPTKALTASLFTNTQTFNTHQFSSLQSLTASLFTNAQTFNAHSIPAVVSPSLFTNTQTFNTHTVGRGAVNLIPTLFNNNQTFNTHAITTAVALTQNTRYDNAQTYVTHTVSPGAVNLSPPFFKIRAPVAVITQS